MQQNAHVPPLVAADLLRRDRLVERLSEAVERPLTVISGPAGSGKTVLAATWAVECAGSGAVVWVTLDEEESDPQTCWAAVVSGLVAPGVRVPAHISPGFLRRLGEELAGRPVPIVLVLDVGDAEETAAFAQDLDDFLRVCGPGLRLVLLTRALPFVALQRRRLEGSVTEIRGADLSFTPAETRELVARSGLVLDSEELALLQARTCGWAAGLRFALAGLLARADTREALLRFSGSSENVASFLLTEVLDVQPPQVRSFLLRTCVLGRLEPGAVEELTGDPHALQVLDFLARGNVFLEQADGADNSRYQPLFREFLRTQLAHESPELAQELHRRAAVWFAAHEDFPTAIRHAVGAGDGALAAAYLVESLGIWSLLAPGPRSAGLAIHGLLVDEDDTPAAGLVRTAVAIRQQDAPRALREVARATTADGPPPTPTFRFTSALLTALADDLGDDVPEALAAARQAQAELGEVSLRRLGAHPEVRVMLAMALGRTLLRRGEFLAASRALQDAVVLASSTETVGPLAESLGLAALTAAASGRLRRARTLAARSEAAAQTEPGGSTPWAGLAAGWAACESLEVALAGELLNEAAGASRRATDPLATSVATLLRARLLRADGQQDAARGTLYAAEELLSDRARGTWPGTAFAVELGEAPTTSDGGDEGGEMALAVAVDLDLDRAESALERGEPSTAVPILVRALDLAAQEDVRRPFVEASEPLRALLTSQHELATRCPWLTGEPKAPAPPEPAPNPTVTLHGQVITPLTHREQEVLTLLADLLTTDEIAESLFVSVNTVRTHIRSVLCKLGANRRNEAVRRAWELGLLERGGAQAAPGLRGMTG